MTADRVLPPLPSGAGLAASPWPRRAAWWAVLAVVLLGHAGVTLWLQENLVGWSNASAPMPQRIEVAFVQELAPTAPPQAPAAVKPARPKTSRAKAPAPAASTPEPQSGDLAPMSPGAVPESLAEAAPDAAEPASAPVAPAELEAASASAATASAVAAAASAPAASSPTFEWPPSTRLTYVLTGNYRGEVYGFARVQWVRQGSRYQVHLDVGIGPSFAPLISRRMTSDGEIGEQGLSPRRYDEATRLPFQSTRRASVLFTPELVTLPNGSQHEAPPGVQDAASQFVQMTWLFTTQPELLRSGNTVTMPLALPRRVGRWIYDVLGEERLRTPIGELDTFHLKPRLGERRPGNELSAEVWFAPALQYLPVRIRIQQDPETYLDLMLDAAPLQAAPPADASAPR